MTSSLSLSLSSLFGSTYWRVHLDLITSSFPRDYQSEPRVIQILSSIVSVPPVVRVEAENATTTTVNESSGTNVSLLCRVVKGNPWNLSNVEWYFNDVLMYEYPNVSNLYLENVSKGFHGNYSCSGKTEAGWGPRSSPVEVVVQCTYLFVNRRLVFDLFLMNGKKNLTRIRRPFFRQMLPAMPVYLITSSMRTAPRTLKIKSSED